MIRNFIRRMTRKGGMGALEKYLKKLPKDIRADYKTAFRYHPEVARQIIQEAKQKIGEAPMSRDAKDAIFMDEIKKEYDRVYNIAKEH